MSAWRDAKPTSSRSHTSHGFRAPSRSSVRDTPKRSATPAVGSSSRHGSGSEKSSSFGAPRKAKKSSRSQPLSFVAEQDEDEGGVRLGSEHNGGSSSSRRSDQLRTYHRSQAIDLDDINNPASQEYYQQQSHSYWTWDPMVEGWYHLEGDGSKRWAPREFA